LLDSLIGHNDGAGGCDACTSARIVIGQLAPPADIDISGMDVVIGGN
jgi:hypothetical protein